RGEISAFLAPVAPGGGEPVEDLASRALGTGDDLTVLVVDQLTVLVPLWNSRLAEVLRDHDVGRHLRPIGRYLGIGHLEDHRAVRIGDPAVPLRPLHLFVRVLSGLGESTGDLQSGAHGALPSLLPTLWNCLMARAPNHKMLWSRAPQTPHLGVGTQQCNYTDVIRQRIRGEIPRTPSRLAFAGG